MNDALSNLLASLIGAGGGITAIASIIASRSRERKLSKKEDVDERISAWQKISDKHERELENMKDELANIRADNRSLELYIRELTAIIAKAVPPLDLPPYPDLIGKPKV